MKKKIILGLLTFVAVFPLRLLYCLSDAIYFVVYYIIGYRKKVVRKNLTDSFPDYSKSEILKIERDFYRYLCDMIVETVKLLHISPGQLSKRVEVVNAEVVNGSVARGKSAALLLGHYGNWEWVQEISRYFTPDAYLCTIYHPLRNKTWDEVYAAIRSRWQIHVVSQRMAPRVLLDAANRPWICGFIADQVPFKVDPEARVLFLNHKTSFVYGPEVIGRKVGADFFFLEMQRMKRGYYRITFHPIHPADDGKPYPVMREFWRLFEAQIKSSTASWLWSHKRWKRDK